MLNRGWRCIIDSLLLVPVINSLRKKFKKRARFFFQTTCNATTVKTRMESSRCPLSVLCTAANFPATMLPLHASLTASRQFLASMGRLYLGCYTGNMRHNLIPNARPSEMVQQNLFILYSKHIVVHDRNRVCHFWNLQHTLREKLNANPLYLQFPH